MGAGGGGRPGVLGPLTPHRFPPRQLSLLSLLLEFPTLLCPDPGSGEAAGASLLATYAHLPPRPAGPPLLRQRLLLAAGTVLLCSDAFGPGSRASRDYASLLLHLASDLNDQRQGPGAHGLRLTALECLRELETCCPGLLARRLDSLRSMQRQEASPAHQSYALLYSLALRNAVLGLARRDHGGLADLLASNEGLAWEAASAASAVSPGEADRLELLAAPGETKVRGRRRAMGAGGDLVESSLCPVWLGLALIWLSTTQTGTGIYPGCDQYSPVCAESGASIGPVSVSDWPRLFPALAHSGTSPVQYLPHLAPISAQHVPSPALVQLSICFVWH